MPSGSTLLVLPAANMSQPPAGSSANLSSRNGHPVAEYDQNDVGLWDGVVMPRGYQQGGTTTTVHWAAGSATTGNVAWVLAWEAMSGLDTDTDSFAADSSPVVTACNGTNGVQSISQISHTDGAAMDSVAVGGLFRLRLTRKAAGEGDTMAGVAQVFALEIRET